MLHERVALNDQQKLVKHYVLLQQDSPNQKKK